MIWLIRVELYVWPATSEWICFHYWPACSKRVRKVRLTLFRLTLFSLACMPWLSAAAATLQALHFSICIDQENKPNQSSQRWTEVQMFSSFPILSDFDFRFKSRPLVLPMKSFLPLYIEQTIPALVICTSVLLVMEFRDERCVISPADWLFIVSSSDLI